MINGPPTTLSLPRPIDFVSSIWHGTVPPEGIEIDTSMFDYHSVHLHSEGTIAPEHGFIPDFGAVCIYGYVYHKADFPMQPLQFSVEGLVVIKGEHIHPMGYYANFEVMSGRHIEVAWPIYDLQKPLKFWITPLEQGAAVQASINIIGRPTTSAMTFVSCKEGGSQ